MKNFFPFSIALLLLVQGCASRQQPQTLILTSSSKWPHKNFKRVAAYFYDCNADSSREIIVDGRLNKSAYPKFGVSLSKSQIQQVLFSVRNTFSTHPRAFCFNPRNGFVFYNSKNQVVAYLSICFECGNYSGFPSGTSQTWDLARLRTVFSELGVKTEQGAAANP